MTFVMRNISVEKVCSPHLGKLNLLLTDTHVLPYAKFDLTHANATATVHSLPYGEDVRICYMRRCHTCRRVNRVIVGPDRFRQDVDTAESIFIR